MLHNVFWLEVLSIDSGQYHHLVIFLYSTFRRLLLTQFDRDYDITRSLGALRAPTSRWRPLDFVLRALRALRPCDPRKVKQHLLFHLYHLRI